ncbi:hypothetical protein HA49_06675 [Tatumella morbirosei]|uniref:Uncharacterized protein n=1 Tax=Tatumella morbirosei TaxID=642227 RepID=A0A095UKI9_9GAMM|nr:hypothetical protein HA49_06675 [Tatumella morbirosei]
MTRQPLNRSAPIDFAQKRGDAGPVPLSGNPVTAVHKFISAYNCTLKIFFATLSVIYQESGNNSGSIR